MPKRPRLRGKIDRQHTGDGEPPSSPTGERVSVFQPEFIEDLSWWIAQDRRVAERLLDLVRAVMRDPFTGIGKPEPLKHLGPNIWSRRLTEEHRVVYFVRHERIDFLMGRYHYE